MSHMGDTDIWTGSRGASAGALPPPSQAGSGDSGRSAAGLSLPSQAGRAGSLWRCGLGPCVLSASEAGISAMRASAAAASESLRLHRRLVPCTGSRSSLQGCAGCAALPPLCFASRAHLACALGLLVCRWTACAGGDSPPAAERWPTAAVLAALTGPPAVRQAAGAPRAKACDLRLLLLARSAAASRSCFSRLLDALERYTHLLALLKASVHAT